MKKIERNEVLPIGEYETIRERFRARVIQEKKARRVRPSDILSATFENRDTVLLQIQEMLRTERITSEDGIQHEIDTYNELVPNEGELSITLFVEIPDKAQRDEMLVKLEGLEKHVAIEIDGERSAAFGQRLGETPGRTTAVHYLKFTLGGRAREALLSQKARVSFVVDHPQHSARVDLAPETVRSLSGDLR
jgi:hypothetical protein